MLKNFPYRDVEGQVIMPKHKPLPVFKTEEYSILGKMVTLALTDDRAWKGGSSIDMGNNYYRDRLTEQIILELTTDQSRMSPRLYKLMRINADMDRVFKDALLGWVSAQAALGQSAHPSCRSFLEYYDIDPDGAEYGLENAYKAWQRSQKEER